MAKAAKRTGSRKTVSPSNLEALGAERLAAILFEAGEDDPSLKRRLRMELAGEVGAEDLAAEISKRLAAVETRRSRVHWRKYKAFVRDLDLQRRMIVGPLAEGDPKLALDYIWRFLRMAGQVFPQVSDARGEVDLVFRTASADLAALVARAKPDATALADQVAAALDTAEDRVLDGLVAAIVQQVDAPSLEVLRRRLRASFDSYARPRLALRTALQHVADAQGDVDGYAGLISANDLRQPAAGAEIARRLLAAGRTEDALAALSRSQPPLGGRNPAPSVVAWEATYLEALEADGQGALAQELRWKAFEQRLAVEPLRAFLKRLPDFDDVEAEDRAIAFASAYPQATDALRFLTEWPAAGAAATLVLARGHELDAGQTLVLEAAASVLEPRHPLAASLVLRLMVADVLRFGRSDRYDAARQALDDLADLAVHVPDWGEVETHQDFILRMSRLRRI